MLNTGIYEIRNTLNGKRYVGSAVAINARLAAHTNSLKKETHPNRYLQFAWSKHGEEAFEFNPLLCCSKEDLLFYEQRALDRYHGRLYNLSPTAGSQLGMQHSEETRRKISKANKGRSIWPNGRVFSEEHRQKISKANKGRLLSEETKQKMSKSRRGQGKGRTLSEEVKLKISESRKGIAPWNKGKVGVYSEETLLRISQASKGRTFSEEARQKMSKARKGRAPWNKGVPHTEETKRRMSEASKGRRHSEETKQKISVGVKW